MVQLKKGKELHKNLYQIKIYIKLNKIYWMALHYAQEEDSINGLKKIKVKYYRVNLKIQLNIILKLIR